MDLSIVIGAYQEAPVIQSSLEQLASYLSSHDHGTVELVVVVADSPDGTADLVRATAKQFAHLRLIEPGPRVGKGRDIQLGMMVATGRYRLFMDADLATPLTHLADIQKLIDRRVAVAAGVRNLNEIHHDLLRRLVSASGNLLARMVLVPGIRDTQCGFKLFEGSAAKAIFGRQTILGWGFDLEILALARYLGYTIDLLPISDWSDPKSLSAGLVGDSTTAAAWQTFCDLWRVKWRLVTGRYRQTSFKP